jgi:hypothetical protein
MVTFWYVTRRFVPEPRPFRDLSTTQIYRGQLRVFPSYVTRLGRYRHQEVGGASRYSVEAGNGRALAQRTSCAITPIGLAPDQHPR